MGYTNAGIASPPHCTYHLSKLEITGTQYNVENSLVNYHNKGGEKYTMNAKDIF